MDRTTRRQFLGVVSLGALLGMSSGTVAAQEYKTEDQGFRPVPTWYGPLSERPAADSSFWNNKSGQVAYLTDNGRLSHLTIGDASWRELPLHPPGYATADLPTDATTGAIYWDENRNLPTWWDTDHYEFPNFVDDVLTDPVTVANTTTRTTVFDPDINANSLVKGRKYQIQISGSFGTANNSDTFSVDVDLAGATNLAGLSNSPSNETAVPWWVQFEFSVREDGVNGVLAPTSFGIFNSVAQQPASAHGTVSVDTTTVTNLSVDIQWDAADPANTVTVDEAHLIQMA